MSRSPNRVVCCSPASEHSISIPGSSGQYLERPINSSSKISSEIPHPWTEPPPPFGEQLLSELHRVKSGITAAYEVPQRIDEKRCKSDEARSALLPPSGEQLLSALIRVEIAEHHEAEEDGAVDGFEFAEREDCGVVAPFENPKGCAEKQGGKHSDNGKHHEEEVSTARSIATQESIARLARPFARFARPFAISLNPSSRTTNAHTAAILVSTSDIPIWKPCPSSDLREHGFSSRGGRLSNAGGESATVLGIIWPPTDSAPSGQTDLTPCTLYSVIPSRGILLRCAVSLSMRYSNYRLLFVAIS
ncbi:hypothetical protein BJ546DRAFT_948260 [Cryomyces antarcticus]